MANVDLRRLALALGAVVALTLLPPVGAQDVVDPDATRILKRMTDYLGGLDRFGVETDNMLEEVLVSGQKIMYDFTAEVVIERPDRLRAERKGDLLRQVIVYDGESLSIYNPADGYYARAAAPDNLDDLLHFARDTLDIVPPTGDMVFTNAYELLTAGITSAGLVGKSVIGGVRCDHLAFTTPLVDWQIWIAEGDRPLPYKYVLTTKDDPSHPQYIVLMNNWDVSPSIDDSTFRFVPPQDAMEIEFLRMDTGDVTID